MYLCVCLGLNCTFPLSLGLLPFLSSVSSVFPSVRLWLCWARVGVVLLSWCLRPRAGSVACLVSRSSPFLGPVLRLRGNRLIDH